MNGLRTYLQKAGIHDGSRTSTVVFSEACLYASDPKFQGVPCAAKVYLFVDGHSPIKVFPMPLLWSGYTVVSVG